MREKMSINNYWFLTATTITNNYWSLSYIQSFIYIEIICLKEFLN